jgi:hypothetical protein
MAIFAALVAAPAAAQAGEDGRLVVLGAVEREILLEDAVGRDGRIGRLTLLVRNDSRRPVRLRVRFIPDGADQPIRLRRLTDAPFRAEVPSLYTNRAALAAGNLTIRPRRAVLVPLRLGVGESADAAIADGILVFAAQADPRVGPAVIRTTGRIFAAPEQQALSAQPTSVTIAVRRWFPGGLFEGWRRVEEPRIWVPGEASNTLTLLASSAGHSMKARLVEAEDTQPVPDGLTEQRLVVADLSAVGTYAGNLELEPGSDKIAVEAKVRDIILWPLVIVGVGALIGGYGATRFQRWRTRRLLLAEVERVRAEYQSRKETSPIGPPPAAASDEALTGLTSEISSAQSSEELDELTERVRGARDAVRVWRAIDTAARAVIEVSHVPPDADVVDTDTQASLDATKWLSDDVAAATRVAAALRRQQRILRAFARAYASWPEEAIRRYRVHTGAFGDDAKTAVLVGSLERTPEQPDLIFVLPDQDEPPFVADYLESLRQGDRLLASTTLDAFGVAPARHVTHVELSPEQIERPVRRWDRRIAIATFFLTILAFVLSVYDDDFGTWDDYAKALGAGLLGQVGGAALWNLFPGLRSYRLPLAKPSK